jgi:hypothetical protein
VRSGVRGQSADPRRSGDAVPRLPPRGQDASAGHGENAAPSGGVGTTLRAAGVAAALHAAVGAAARRLRCRTPERIVAQRLAGRLALGHQLDEGCLRRPAVGGVIAVGHERRHLLGREPAAERLFRSGSGVSGGAWWVSVGRGGHEDVVGSRPAESPRRPGRSRLTERRSKGAVKRTGPPVVAVLPWSSRAQRSERERWRTVRTSPLF